MKTFLLSALFLFLIPLQAQTLQRKDFANMLNLQTESGPANDVNINMFSDLGAWHAYYFLPETDLKIGFGGPVVMEMQGRRIADCLAELEIRVNGQPAEILSNKTEKTYYPGLMTQRFETKELTVTQELLFANSRQARVKTVISNKSSKKADIEIKLKGSFPALGNLNYKSDKVLKYDFPDSSASFEIHFDKIISVNLKDNEYDAFLGKFKLASGNEMSFVQSEIYSPEDLNSHKLINTTLDDFDSQLIQNKQRWNGYLNKLFEHIHPRNEAEKRLAIKSMITLMTNWRSPAGDLKHNGVFPSVSYQGFYGFWSWDSWKIAVGVSLFDPELAEDIIRSMFDFMNEEGMIADCVYFDSSDNNWRDTKPPLSAWGVWEVFQKSGNREFIEEMYPQLVKYHDWWYKERDYDTNGLCEYGSTDGTLIAAKWESGMDNAVRFDDAELNKLNEHAWTFDIESVDLNAYLYAEKIYLAKMAREMGLEEEALDREKEASSLKETINKKFYDSKTGYYYDRSTKNGELISAAGPEGWISLWTEVADAEQASGVRALMMNNDKFNTYVPLPTLAADHPKFNPLKGYWRGPVWIDQFYFGVAGLNKYRYTQEAEALIAKFFQNAEGLLEQAPLYENYHPMDGKGLNAQNFSWTAAHILLLLAPES